MKMHKPIAILALLAISLSSGVASAHGRGHVGLGFYFGPGPYYYPYYARPYYPYPYYGYPPVVLAPQPESPMYIEQGDEVQASDQSAARQDYYWYHCDKPEGYYPYIKECPGGWQKVTPEPPKR